MGRDKEAGSAGVNLVQMVAPGSMANVGVSSRHQDFDNNTSGGAGSIRVALSINMSGQMIYGLERRIEIGAGTMSSLANHVHDGELDAQDLAANFPQKRCISLEWLIETSLFKLPL